MPKVPNIASVFRGHYLPWVVSSALALPILGGTIFCAAFYVRTNTRQQIAGREAWILYQVCQGQKLTKEGEDALGPGEKAFDQLPAVLHTARLPQIADLLGTRLFDVNGILRYADANLPETALSPEDLAELRHLNPVAHFDPVANLSKVSIALWEQAPSTGPLLEVNIPLHSPGHADLSGVAQFILNGKNVARAYDKLDRTLIVQGTSTFLIGGGLLVAVLALGFRHLQQISRVLAERT